MTIIFNIITIIIFTIITIIIFTIIRFFTKVPSVLQTHKNANWILFIDDDTMVFLKNVFVLISQFDSSLPWNIGYHSECHESIMKHGAFAYGGGGMLFSRGCCCCCL